MNTPPTHMGPVGTPTRAYVPPKAPGSVSVSFLDTVRSESIKVRTVRSFWITNAIAIAFPVLITLLTGLFDDADPFGSDGYAGLFAGLCYLTGLAVGAFGVTALTSEYSQQTIRVSYAATPNRLQVHLAKLLVISLVALLAQFIAFVSCWVLAKAFNTDALSLFAGPVFTTFIATLVMGPLIAFFGYAIGLNIRNTAGSIALLLLIPLIIEGLIQTILFIIWAPLAKWMPFRALFVATVSGGGGDAEDLFGMLPRPWAQLWFFAVAAALWGLGMFREMRRDA